MREGRREEGREGGRNVRGEGECVRVLSGDGVDLADLEEGGREGGREGVRQQYEGCLEGRREGGREGGLTLASPAHWASASQGASRKGTPISSSRRLQSADS